MGFKQLLRKAYATWIPMPTCEPRQDLSSALSYNASEESSFGERIEFVHKIMHRATAATSKGDNVEMSDSFNAKEDQNCLNLNDHSSWTPILGQ